MNREDKRKLIIDYFKSGEKKDKKIGVEFEHFAVEKTTGKTHGYFGIDSVADVLKDLEKDGWKGYYNDEYILGLEKGPYTISTEPAGQFEVSIEKEDIISRLEELYKEFMAEILPCFNKRNLYLVTTGYQPISKIEDIKISPKKRYKHMYDYFKTRGERSHNMMKGTAALQVSIDYSSEEDFIKKYRTISCLSPVFYNLFDNSYIFENAPSPIRNIRQYIWENTDPERSSVPSFVFDKDLSYSKYADYILDSKPIFIEKKDGQLEATEGKSFEEVFDAEEDIEKQIYHAASIIFPDVRLKKYIEIRMMDAIPYPLNFSAISLIKGIFYSQENLEILYEHFSEMTYEDFLKERHSGKEKGLDGLYHGKTYGQWAEYLYKLAEKNLKGDKTYLEPLKELIDKGKIPRDIFKETMEKEGIIKAIEKNRIEV